MLKLKEFFANYIVGFVVYVSMEALFRFVTGQKAGTNAYLNLFLMGNLGGVVLNLIGVVIKIQVIDFLPYKIKAIISGLIISGCEFLSGIMINKILNLGGWDYSGEILGNLFLGQTCLKFIIIWIIVSPFVFWLHDTICDIETVKKVIEDKKLSDDEIRQLQELTLSFRYLAESYRKLLFAWGKEIWIV